MKAHTPVVLSAGGFLFLGAQTVAQSVPFDFDTAPLHAPLPVTLTVGGITAEFSATGQGFSIQEAATMGFTPVGFSGFCIYPSSVFAADLLISFSPPLTNFSILYAPQELACDSSARMRVTAYQDAVLVGTSTTTAEPPGTWPSATLAFSPTTPFNKVVVHYDAPPPTGGDWGPIFMADNMQVSPGPPALRVSAAAGAGAAVLAWPVANSGFTLQQSFDLGTHSWSLVTNAVNVVGNENQVLLSPLAGAQFYRLVQP
jgi:hypothetical protein